MGGGGEECEVVALKLVQVDVVELADAVGEGLALGKGWVLVGRSRCDGGEGDALDIF